MKYLLDTNICIYIIKKKPLNPLRKISSLGFNDVGISTITLSELEYGVKKSSNPERNSLALIEFLSVLNIHDYDDSAAREYGIIRAYLESKGQPIGALDLLIAAHAKSLGLIIVTNNVREFKRVPGLRLENWV